MNYGDVGLSNWYQLNAGEYHTFGSLSGMSVRSCEING